MSTPVLDVGYVDLIESWGSDARIIESARMSSNKGFQGWDTDAKLLEYLYTHKHMTPFEMCGMTIEVKAPIFVFREWHRHRTQSYNEMSARYIPLPHENYMPDLHETINRAISIQPNRQKSGISPAHESEIHQWHRALFDLYQRAQQVYEQGLSAGVPKELARLSVPVGRYSRMRASANLRNWLVFLTLRMDQTSPTFPVHLWGVNRILSGIWVFDKQPSPIEQKNSQNLVMGSIDISGLMRLRQGRLNSPPVYRKC